ncbi:Fe(3+) ABC transporter substrate-binding protein [Rhodovulum sulfidophilum]|uniref:Fe(3+) ABC transporter substrate-binding protein n=1 Tax=Rhodovulum sulfidophilum TaxID=35806 RepID=A0ABS1RNS2_RHOSU|nr:Fe(3+) ABC transporter substrate-binding protein [Rhodovulum sulfidophilum]MBL3554101.1 Fe(3+) ABC transporter substrate-binding protein [Rhodovulum sulfidophilum]MBL3559532.1 Fe(3+) ABC transporter substrate-binding protein [Rhodovulum sulfidophilum]MBL3572671.1 Fe(3+) ABC transporter substrate-binding protein [Rhodovulum sulfidophilum]MBL3607712.1 Fe(3+) ABC transporter substrate-binding protein [Rhodovulum sulfidophilum]MCE8432544.1 Fe(3+) ABC transporter substrate-binding protein [Rhodo
MTLRTALAATAAAATLAPTAQADVNIYSYRQPELIQPILDAFTEDTGIATNIAFLNKGLVERLQAEGARSPADIILTVDVARLAAAVDAGVTQAVDSDTLVEKIPAAFRDADNHWFGVTTRARIVYAAKDRVDPSEITTYEELADPKWKGRICTRSGTHAYTLALVAAMIHHHGEEAAKTWLEGVKANLARKPQGNDRAQVKAIWAGECDLSLGNTYYMGQMLKDPEQEAWAKSVNVLFPTFEGGGTHVNISGIAMTKAAPNREEALQFMEYLTSDHAQEIYAEVNYEYPVVPGTEPSDLVKSWGSFTADDVNLIALSRDRAAALRLVEEVDFDG